MGGKITNRHFTQIRVKEIASAKSWSVWRSFTLSGFMGSCLTISHTCLHFLPSRQASSCVPGVIEGSEDTVWA